MGGSGRDATRDTTTDVADTRDAESAPDAPEESEDVTAPDALSDTDAEPYDADAEPVRADLHELDQANERVGCRAWWNECGGRPI